MIFALAFVAIGAHSNWLIDPGRGIGLIRLGEERTHVEATLGQSNGPDQAAMGHIWSIWKGASGHEVDVYTVRGMGDSAAHPENFVQQIRVTSPRFHTVDGLHVGMTLAAIRRSRPHVRLDKVENPATVYDDRAAGIAFEFLRGNCSAILIHRKGVPVSQVYLGFGPSAS